MDNALARPKFYRTALLFFAGFALLLAVIGLYGVVSCAVAQRTREMGVRLALGTTPGRLRTMLLWQGLLSVAVVAAMGIAGATMTRRFLESLVNGAKPFDLATFTLSTLSASECIAVLGAVFIAALMGYGKIRSALESSAGGKVNPRFLAAVLLRVK
jgi:ABC-type antimicrobial peptide transport system permease subunit